MLHLPFLESLFPLFDADAYPGYQHYDDDDGHYRQTQKPNISPKTPPTIASSVDVSRVEDEEEGLLPTAKP